MDFLGDGQGNPWESQVYENRNQRSSNEDEVVGSGSGSVVIEREHMFDKVVTPSDVGKLNRLVIPKQFAEKYFPLDSSSNEKGLLLNFEDRNGKPWRFRYSYWNSSQSYVMTKGWSRFVKEKKLDAGDIVSFQRGVGELGRECLYIDWRRRPDVPDPSFMLPHHHHFFHRSALPWSPLLLRPPTGPGSTSVYTPYYRNCYNGSASYGYNNVPGSVYYMRPQQHQLPQQIPMVQSQGGVEPMVYDSVPVVHGKAAAKRLRLFGVNMECSISESESSHQASPHSQLCRYNGTPVVPSMQPGYMDKGKTSMSLDLDLDLDM